MLLKVKFFSQHQVPSLSISNVGASPALPPPSLQHGKTAPRTLYEMVFGNPLQQSPGLASSPLALSQSVVQPPLTAWQYHSTVMPCHPSHTPFLPLSQCFSSSFSPLGPNNCWVMGSVRQCSILAVVEEAVAPATVADEEKGSQEDQGTDGAGFPLQQKAEQVEAHEHRVVEPQSRVQRLGDEQHGE